MGTPSVELGEGRVKIKSIRLKNFRSFADETFSIDPYTCLIGANGAGKSTLLCALNIFFRETSNTTPIDFLLEEDFHQKRTQQRIEITVAFSALTDFEKADLKDYVRNDELIVSSIAEFDEEKGRAPVKQFGSRLGLPEFAPFFAAHKANAPAETLNGMFADLRARFPGIADGKSKDAKRDALNAYEADPANVDKLSPIESEDQFYGFAGASRLRAHIQWVYVPAVKDASDEQSESKDGALGKLLARTVRARVNFKDQLSGIEAQAQEQYSSLLAQNQAALDEVGNALSRRLSQWSHPDVGLRLSWAAPPVSVREPTAKVIAEEQGFEGDIVRFGHGFQRSYLLALLQELASIGGDAGPTLILGVEEPELYQHPPQARYLAQTLQLLSSGSAQVVLTTHSPYFIGGASFKNVRLIRKARDSAASSAKSLTFERYAERYAGNGERPRPPTAIEVLLNEVLRPAINEMFFATKLVLVEGPEDVAYVLTWAALSGRLDEFRARGVHVVAVEGKQNLSSPIIIAQELGIPLFVVFDGDRSQQLNGQQVAHNSRLLRILGDAGDDLFPQETRWGAGFVQWPENIGDLVGSELAESLGRDVLEVITQQAMAECGHAPSLKKNTRFIQAKMQLSHAAGGVSPSLNRLCTEIVEVGGR